MTRLDPRLIGGVVDQVGGTPQELQQLLNQACTSGLLHSCQQLLEQGARASEVMTGHNAVLEAGPGATAETLAMQKGHDEITLLLQAEKA